MSSIGRRPSEEYYYVAMEGISEPEFENEYLALFGAGLGSDFSTIRNWM